MTPEERARFEKEILHDDKEKGLGGPASEPEVREERRKQEGSVLQCCLGGSASNELVDQRAFLALSRFHIPVNSPIHSATAARYDRMITVTMAERTGTVQRPWSHRRGCPTTSRPAPSRV